MKTATKVLAVIVIVVGLYHIGTVRIDHRFDIISEGRVYQSGRMPPKEIVRYVDRYEIKTVIDLRHPRLHDPLNPGSQDDIDREREAIDALAGVRHVNIPSGQIPAPENLRAFFEVMDDGASYPVLIHCHHGTGRSILYSAIYRIEYEAFSNERARAKTRFVVAGSSFDEGRSKGDFLIDYRSRSEVIDRMRVP